MKMTGLLHTDLYQLAMLKAYYDAGMEDEAVFEFFVRELPEGYGYLVAAGLAQVVDTLEDARFSDEELINVALAIARRSQWRIPFHVMHAVRAGASREEILEAGFLAAVTRGGLTLPDLVPLMRALDELSDG